MDENIIQLIIEAINNGESENNILRFTVMDTDVEMVGKVMLRVSNNRDDVCFVTDADLGDNFVCYVEDTDMWNLMDIIKDDRLPIVPMSLLKKRMNDALLNLIHEELNDDVWHSIKKEMKAKELTVRDIVEYIERHTDEEPRMFFKLADITADAIGPIKDALILFRADIYPVEPDEQIKRDFVIYRDRVNLYDADVREDMWEDGKRAAAEVSDLLLI